MITVAAAIIHNEQGEILICKRGSGGSCAHLWEFPGGKLEAGETLEECLIRECREEVAVEIVVENLYEKTVYHYPERKTAIYFYRARIKSGCIQQLVHEDIQWVSPGRLTQFPFCPADLEMIQKMAQEPLH